MASLTLFVDASWCPQTYAAGWGMWAKKDGWDSGRTSGGIFIKSITCARDAEIAAIANGVHVIRNELKGVEKIYIQSDCMNALNFISANFNVRYFHSPHKTRFDASAYFPKSPLEMSAVQVISDNLKETGIILKWVAGHKKGTTRNAVNNICHDIAYSNMQQMREKLTLEV